MLGGMARRNPTNPSWEEFAREFGINLARARAVRGLSQERIAHMAGISAFTYQKYEKGESKPGTPANPEFKTLVALSQALNVPLVDLIPKRLPDMTGGG